MKPPRRPPLILTDTEATAAVPETGLGPLAGTGALDGMAADRPMSERRRRRLAEEQRQAEARAAAQAQAKVVVPEFAESAEAPPVPYEPFAATVSLPRREKPQTGSAYVIAGVAAALWIGGLAAWLAYEVGSGAVELEPLRIAVYALIALAPAGLAVMLAHAVRQGAGLAAETRHARNLSDALLAPTALAAQQTGQVLQSLRGDIDMASLAAERARNDMTLLREALSLETVRLNDAAETASQTARRLTDALGQQRVEMSSLGERLDLQATGVTDAVERQSRMVVDASDLAQTQLREAEAALAARAADMAAAAGEAQDAARAAADDLARQTLRLENAGSGVTEQIQSVEEGLGQQRAALVAAAYALRTDQEDFSAQVESQRAQLSEQLSATRTVADELGATSSKTTESVKDLIEAATDQFRALMDMSQREADAFDSATKVALDRFEAVAAEARDAVMDETRRSLTALQATADETRAAAAGAAEEAQMRADRLGEALFEAAQKADQAADARVGTARRIVSETTGLVEEAGDKAVERLESLLERLNSALSQVDDAIGDLDERSARLPEEARRRVDDVRATVEEGLAALTAASQKAADDTEALDTSFQERVRRNYDMLTETVRLMGVVSGDTAGNRRNDTPPPPPLPEARRERPARGPAPPAVPDVEPEPEPKPKGHIFGLRNRLKLEPTSNTPSPANVGGLGWSDLEQTDEAPLDLDTPAMPPAESEALGERIISSIRRMGVDPNALLPRARIEEAAQAFTAGEPDRARQIVRRVAPAAVRSVSRRVLTDPDLRADAEAYVREIARDLGSRANASDGPWILGRLTSDTGRAFLLLDAAVGDMA